MTDQIAFTDEQQEYVDKLVGDARVKARTKAETEQAAKVTKEQDTASKTALAAEKKWKELAAVHEARVKALEPLEAQAKAYETLLDGMLKDRVKALGDAAKQAIAALPTAMTSVEKLEWLNKNEALFQTTGDGVGTPQRPAQTGEAGTPSGPISRYPIRL